MLHVARLWMVSSSITGIEHRGRERNTIAFILLNTNWKYTLYWPIVRVKNTNITEKTTERNAGQEWRGEQQIHDVNLLIWPCPGKSLGMMREREDRCQMRNTSLGTVRKNHKPDRSIKCQRERKLVRRDLVGTSMSTHCVTGTEIGHTKTTDYASVKRKQMIQEG